MHLERSIAAELGPHAIGVNVVSPGLTLTDTTKHLPQEARDASARMTPLGRNSAADDGAGMILAIGRVVRLG